MLNLTTALGRNGFQDWLLQRVTAAILALYVTGMLIFWLITPELDFIAWQTLFACDWVCYATLLSLIALMVHAWIGMWTIVTDYLHTPALQIFTLILIFTALLFDLIWGVQILWG